MKWLDQEKEFPDKYSCLIVRIWSLWCLQDIHVETYCKVYHRVQRREIKDWHVWVTGRYQIRQCHARWLHRTSLEPSGASWLRRSKRRRNQFKILSLVAQLQRGKGLRLRFAFKLQLIFIEWNLTYGCSQHGLCHRGQNDQNNLIKKNYIFDLAFSKILNFI
jgi:hypothetical protein